MAEETLSEALANLNDDNIDSAAVPVHKQPDIDDPQEESTFIDLSEEDEISPVTEDQVQENFEDGSLGQDDAELSEVEKEAKKAQNRVNQAIKQAKDYQRRELQALQYAKQLQEENKKLSSQIQLEGQQTAQSNLELSKNYSNEFEGRIDAQVDAAKVALKTAYDSGDQNLMVDAQQQLARAEAERNQIAQYKRDIAKYEQDLAQWQAAQANVQQEFPDYDPQQNYLPQAQPQYSQPSEKATSWAEKNEWFRDDQAMTFAAFGIHKELVEEGVDPTSDKYYAEVDKRMAENFPHKFSNEQPAPVQQVAASSRGASGKKSSRKIKLTPSQVAIAKRLNVPLEEYARHMEGV